VCLTTRLASRSYGDVLDISARITSGGELGLLGFAFHPNFPTDPRVFVDYIATVNGALVSHISSFTTTDGGATINAATEIVLMTVNQPQTNHKGGNLVFGPDGYLYIGFGDGGGTGDTHGTIGNGQNLNTLLGKILRIDVGTATATTYSIPADKPLREQSALWCRRHRHPGLSGNLCLWLSQSVALQFRFANR